MPQVHGDAGPLHQMESGFSYSSMMAGMVSKSQLRSCFPSCWALLSGAASGRASR